MNMIKKLRIGWISLLALLAVLLASLAVVPFGRITYAGDFLKDSYFIGRLTPRERLAGNDGAAARTLVGEPAYFSLFTPRPFRRAEVTIEYSGEAPLLEIGLRRDKTVWHYERLPLWHAGLELLADNKNTLRQDGLMLWQKDMKYSSIADFFKNPPPADQVAVYNYDLPGRYRLNDYRPADETRIIEVGARGNYLLQTYSAGEAIDMAFTVRDLNANKDEDELVVSVYDEAGRALVTGKLADDGGNPGQPSALRELRVATGALPAGPYRVEVKANDDIVTERIATKQSRVSFINRLWLADAGRTNFKMASDVPALSVQTIAPGSRQTVRFADTELKVAQTYTQFSAAAPDGFPRLKSIGLQKDDVIISGDGVFAFSDSDLINTSSRQFTAVASAAAMPPYVLARYEPAGQAGKRTVTFALSGAYREKGKYSFMIAAPGITTRPAGVEITSARFELSGPSVFEYLKRLAIGA